MKRKGRNRRPGDWIIDSMEASYKDKNGIRMWYGLGEYACDNFTRPMIIVDFSKYRYNQLRKKYRFITMPSRYHIYSGTGGASDMGPLMAECEFWKCELFLRPFKVAHRWFLKRARRLRYFSGTLKDLLKPDGCTLDIDRVYKEYGIVGDSNS